ncbi:hypothetical protein AALA80_04195 [Oscillospiraceae bacterium 50-60]
MQSTLENYQKVYQMLADEESKDIYIDCLNWRVSGDSKYIGSIEKNYIETAGFYCGKRRRVCSALYRRENRLFCMERENTQKDICHFGMISALPAFAAGQKKSCRNVLRRADANRKAGGK